MYHVKERISFKRYYKCHEYVQLQEQCKVPRTNDGVRCEHNCHSAAVPKNQHGLPSRMPKAGDKNSSMTLHKSQSLVEMGRYRRRRNDKQKWEYSKLTYDVQDRLMTSQVSKKWKT